MSVTYNKAVHTWSLPRILCAFCVPSAASSSVWMTDTSLFVQTLWSWMPPQEWPTAILEFTCPCWRLLSGPFFLSLHVSTRFLSCHFLTFNPVGDSDFSFPGAVVLKVEWKEGSVFRGLLTDFTPSRINLFACFIMSHSWESGRTLLFLCIIALRYIRLKNKVWGHSHISMLVWPSSACLSVFRPLLTLAALAISLKTFLSSNLLFYCYSFL